MFKLWCIISIVFFWCFNFFNVFIIICLLIKFIFINGLFKNIKFVFWVRYFVKSICWNCFLDNFFIWWLEYFFILIFFKVFEIFCYFVFLIFWKIFILVYVFIDIYFFIFIGKVKLILVFCFIYVIFISFLLIFLLLMEIFFWWGIIFNIVLSKVDFLVLFGLKIFVKVFFCIFNEILFNVKKLL